MASSTDFPKGQLKWREVRQRRSETGGVGRGSTTSSWEPRDEFCTGDEVILGQQEAVIRRWRMAQGESRALQRMGTVLKTGRMFLFWEELRMQINGCYVPPCAVPVEKISLQTKSPVRKSKSVGSSFANCWMLTEPKDRGSTESYKNMNSTKHLQW